PSALRDEATSLRIETGRAWSRVEMTAALLKSLHREYGALERGGATGNIIRRFEVASSYAHGRRVHVDENGGYDGTTDGLDERGFLRVRTAGNSRTVLSGGVRPIE